MISERPKLDYEGLHAMVLFIIPKVRIFRQELHVSLQSSVLAQSVSKDIVLLPRTHLRRTNLS